MRLRGEGEWHQHIFFYVTFPANVGNPRQGSLWFRGELPDHEGNIALHYAAERGTVGIKQLIRGGAIVNWPNNEWQTPLHWAAKHGNSLSIHHLLKNEADVNQADRLGNTPLHVVAENGQHHVVAVLIEYGQAGYVNSNFII